MGAKLYLSFLWHMHQPWYKEPRGGYTMPWVFLHAIKDYYEMPWMLSRFPTLKATFNLVPSLIEQLEEYARTDVNDPLLKLLQRPPSTLEASERETLVKMLFWANPKTMIYPLPRYYELYRDMEHAGSEALYAQRLSNEELTDLGVLFLLSWCGLYLRRHDPVVSTLLAQGVGFSHDQLRELIGQLCGFISAILPFYRTLADEGQVSLSTSPYFHPILPLLIDPQAATAADARQSAVAGGFRMAEDAEAHVAMAQDLFQSRFGREATGFWPAEGSVSPDALALLADHGATWVATDEEILAKSLTHGARETHYRRWRYEGHEKRPVLFFRDKELSDLIGFTYTGWSAKEAAADFVGRLAEIRDRYAFDPFVGVFLDGENAWEYYNNNGFDFFEELYRLLEATPWIQTLTLDEAAHHEGVGEGRLERLGFGSWIGGTFATWVGHPEKSAAWEMLYRARRALQSRWEILDEATRVEAKHTVMIAEGSDWFWWYGEDHPSPHAPLFDTLFRAHLGHIYTLAGLEPDERLAHPLKSRALRSPWIAHPKGPVKAHIDGQESDYFEWLSAGRVDLQFDASTMDTSALLMRELWYGCDNSHLYLAITGVPLRLADGEHAVGIDLMAASKIRIRLGLQVGQLLPVCYGAPEGWGVEAAFGRLLEIALPLEGLIRGPKEHIELSLKLFHRDRMVERLPLYTALPLELRHEELRWLV